MESQQQHFEMNSETSNAQLSGNQNGFGDDLIQDVISQKKRTYRLEIRKRKLQNVFDKIRKPAPPLSIEQLQQQQLEKPFIQAQYTPLSQTNTHNNSTNYINTSNSYIQEVSGAATTTTVATADEEEIGAKVESMYEQNRNLQIELETKSKEFASFEEIAGWINELNVALFNMSAMNGISNHDSTVDSISITNISSNLSNNTTNGSSSTDRLDQLVNEIFNRYLKEEEPEEIYSHLKQLFLHMSLLAILKHPRVSITTKNIAIWSLINLSSSENDPFDIIGKLVLGDIIPLLKSLLKDIKYAPLYENIIWLAVNISIDKECYRLKLLEEGFLLFLNNILLQISKGMKSGVKSDPEFGIPEQFLSVVLNLCVSFLSVHSKIDIDQYRVILSIMTICVKSNKPKLFSQCVQGMLNLFSVTNMLSTSKFQMMFQEGFFSAFFMGCMYREDDAEAIGQLFRNLSYLNAETVMMLVKQDLCMPIYLLLDHPLKQVRIDIAFCLSNFLLNGKAFVSVASQLMLDVKVIVMLKNECWEIQREAVFALASLLESQDRVQKEEFLSNKDTIQVMCEFFNEHYEKFDDELIDKMLFAFFLVLEFGEYTTSRDPGYSNNPFFIAIEFYASIPTFENIITHGSPNNSQKALEILENYSWSKNSQIDGEEEEDKDHHFG